MSDEVAREQVGGARRVTPEGRSPPARFAVLALILCSKLKATKRRRAARGLAFDQRGGAVAGTLMRRRRSAARAEGRVGTVVRAFRLPKAGPLEETSDFNLCGCCKGLAERARQPHQRC